MLGSDREIMSNGMFDPDCQKGIVTGYNNK